MHAIMRICFSLILYQIEDNTSLPVTISSVRILHANRTRRSFLERVVNPLLSANRGDAYTLEEALKEVGEATNKLNRFGRTARD
jgi:outer membrane protein insertion porin family